MSDRRESGRPFILGLTGSIAMGKSTVARMFAEAGVPVFDADAAVHAMQGPGGALVAPIEAAFPGMTGPEGLRRQELGALVFGDKAALALLEEIVHPAVARMRQEFLQLHGSSPAVVFDIPLLFEKGGAELVDAVAVVSAPYAVQRARVLSRPGMTQDKFERIIALQVPDAEKRERADFVIDTSGNLDATRVQVSAIVRQLPG